MSTLAITFFEVLQEAGVSQDKAKSAVESLEQSINQTIDSRYAIHSRTLATQGDVEKTRVEIEKTRVEIEKIRGEMEKMKYELVRWIVGTGISAIVILYGLLHGLPK